MLRPHTVYQLGGWHLDNMIDLELPIGKRTRAYRFWEIIPSIISYGMLLLLVVLSIFSPFAAAIYLLLIIVTMFVKAIGIAYHTITGHRQLMGAQRVDWHHRLYDLEDPEASYDLVKDVHSNSFDFKSHKQNLRLVAADPEHYPKPSQIYHSVIIATYNEAYDVLQPTIEAVKATSTDAHHIILVIAYEERGGEEIAQTVRRLKKEYAGVFFGFETVMHPMDLPDEVIGKGSNISYAGLQLKDWCDTKKIEYSNVLVTTLDADNRPHATYFDYAAYEYIVREERKHLSFQPIALYFGNIWDAPAPMRVIATGNSFWTIISSMRPHSLHNFAAHSQPMDALVEMNFWSTRSIVEDGHQFWRSYFYFNGDYGVVPLHVPIYQDAVMADTYGKTLVAQFKQLRRWGYGVSDIPYVGVRLFSKQRNVPFWSGLLHLVRLVDSHVTLATTAILVTFGGWVPLLINSQAARDYSAHLLPEVVSHIQQAAMVGLFITILLTLRMLPPRPERYKRNRTLMMVAQWILMPVTSICYSSLASFNAQTHLMLGKYLDKFDVTEKATVASQERVKQEKLQKKADRVALRK